MADWRVGGPFDEPDDDDEELRTAREDMEALLDEAEGDPFVALDDALEDNPAYDEYEDQIHDARNNAYAMMDDLDHWEAQDAADDPGDGGFFDE
jgi:hypothetical protein